jgi:hypothetical protein
MYQILSQALSGPWHIRCVLAVAVAVRVSGTVRVKGDMHGRACVTMCQCMGGKLSERFEGRRKVRSVGTHKQDSGLQYACIPIRAHL